jgi:hypothetical protein
MAPRKLKSAEIEQPCAIPPLSELLSTSPASLLDLSSTTSLATTASSGVGTDPFDGPVVPLLLGAMAVAGAIGAVIDGVGMFGRAVRRA